MKTTIRQWLRAFYIDETPMLGDVYLDGKQVASFSTAQVHGQTEVRWRDGGRNIYHVDHEIEVVPNMDTARDLVARLVEHVEDQNDPLALEAAKFLEDVAKHYPF